MEAEGQLAAALEEVTAERGLHAPAHKVAVEVHDERGRRLNGPKGKHERADRKGGPHRLGRVAGGDKPLRDDAGAQGQGERCGRDQHCAGGVRRQINEVMAVIRQQPKQARPRRGGLTMPQVRSVAGGGPAA